jgi:hypothetical protein
MDTEESNFNHNGGHGLSDSMGRCNGGRGGLVSLIMHEEQHL